MLWILATVSLMAQQQERKLLERIQRPDMQLESQFQSKSYSGSSGPNFKSSPLSKKSYGANESPLIKEFSGSRSFLGIKNPWFGQRVFAAKSASLISRTGFDPSKSYDDKQASTATYVAASKKANSSKTEVPQKPFLVQGGAQGAMQQISDKVKKEMTIDDVRELLNKPQ
jgi:hypothetical protein